VPKGAKVEVFRPGQVLLAEGRLDEQGNFLFRYAEPEELRVVVSAGVGHRKEFLIPREWLDGSMAYAETVNQSGQPSANVVFPRTVPQAGWRERFKDVLLGITFLLAVAAFILSWRNGRKLRDCNTTVPPLPRRDHPE
jgi:hypothetical protein